jgi:hypothetical protein
MALFQALAQAGGPPAHVLMDSSAVKAHRSAAEGKGGSRTKPSAAARSAAGPQRPLDEVQRYPTGQRGPSRVATRAGSAVS